MNPTKTLHTLFTTITGSNWHSQEERIRFQYYSLFLMFGIPLMVIFGIINVTKGSYWVSALATISACSLTIGWLLIKHSRKGIIVYRINSSLYLFLLTYLLIYGGHGGSKVLWLYTFPLVSFFLFGKREGVKWSGVTVAIMTLLLYFPNQILAVYPYHAEFKLRLIASYLTVTGIAFWLEHLRHHYSTSLQAKNKALNEEIVERKKIEQQHDQLMLEVQAANQAKSEFIANMSHEIRTPLNGVIGMTSMLLDTKLDKQQQHYAKTLLTSGEFLLTIINDILDVSKIEAGKFELNIRPFNLRNMLDRFIDVVTRKIYKNNVELVVWAEPTIPSHLLGDADRLQQILLNLTSNALKFTPEGSVTVKISTQDDSPSHLTLRFTVKDTGIGIAQEDQSKLFHSYSQIDTPTTREYCGTGLGLNISKQLCQQMGGQIGVDSHMGKGSEFWFIIRLAKHQQEIDEEAVLLPLHDKSALVATEDETLSEMITAHLTHWGVTIQSTPSPDVLQETLEQEGDGNRPNLLIIDQACLKVSPSDFFMQLEQSINVETQQVIFLQEENEHLENVPQYISQHLFIINKPIRHWELETIYSSHKPVENEGFSSTPSNDSQPPRTVSWREAQILLAEDNPINREVLIGLLAKSGITKVDYVDNGVEVLAALERSFYSLILMDVSMPIMDGIQATKEIRSSTFSLNSSTIPIIALTAHAIAGDRERCLQAGMNDYLTKPVNPEELLGKLELLMQAPHIKPEKTSEENLTTMGTTDFNSISQFDYTSLLERMLGDKELVQGVLNLCLTEMPQQLDKLSESISNQDYENSVQLAHKIAGGVANLSINRMHAIAKELQHECKNSNKDSIENLLSTLKNEFNEVQHTISEFSP